MRMVFSCAFCAVVLTSAPAAMAQTVAQCLDAQTQQAMNACAAKEYRAADDALNAAWPAARAFAKAIGNDSALLDAQRKWLAYRDAACTVQASAYEGGSLQPFVHAKCLTSLTVARTRLLLDLHGY